MRTIDRLCKEMLEDVRNEVFDALAYGDERVTVERDYNDCTLNVEYSPVRTSLGWMMVKDVWVTHDTERELPLVTEALKNAIPEWSALQYEWEKEQSPVDETFYGDRSCRIYV